MSKDNSTSGTFHISSGDPLMDEARAKLMASIRETGGASQAGLKKVENLQRTPEVNPSSQRRGPGRGRGDLMTDLARNLASRGRGGGNSTRSQIGRSKEK